MDPHPRATSLHLPAVIRWLFKPRPFLWIAALLILARLTATLTWGRQTSYDDVALGTAALAVMAPFVIPGQWLGLSFGASVDVGIVLLVTAHFLVAKWRKKTAAGHEG